LFRDVESGDLARRADRDATKKERVPILRENEIVRMKPRDLLRLFAVHQQHPDRRFAVILSREANRLRVGCPRQAADRAVEIDRRVLALPELSLINYQRLLVR